jgi:hypothetical protein
MRDGSPARKRVSGGGLPAAGSVLRLNLEKILTSFPVTSFHAAAWPCVLKAKKHAA